MSSTSPVVLALPHPRVYGHPRNSFRREDRGTLLPLGEALSRPWTTDAHLTGYSASRGEKPSKWRLTSEAPGEFEIQMNLAIFDCDAPGHAASDEWWTAELPKLARLPGSPFIYRTRGGYRIVWKLAEPFPIKTTAGAAEWKARYLAFCDQLLRDFGIECDRSCSDFSRLFRLPRACRDGVVQDFETIGDPTAIGTIALPPGATQIHPSPEGRAKAKSSDAQSRNPDDFKGSLYELLDRKGLIIGPASKPGAYLIRCPRERFHSVGYPGDGSTLFFVTNTLFGPGVIDCKHDACSNHRNARAWRRAIADYVADANKQGDEPHGCVTPGLRPGGEFA